MTEQEFNRAWDNYELETEFNQYCADNQLYNLDQAFECFAEDMITE